MMSGLARQRQEFLENEPNINQSFARYNALSKKWVTTDDCRECKLCGWLMKLEATNCDQCGSPSLRLVRKNSAVYPPSKGQVAHFSRRVEYCWNESMDPDSGAYIAHKFDEAVRQVVDIKNEESHQEHYCKTCGIVYNWSDGKTATPQEIQDARNGKLPLKTRNRDLIVQSARD